MSPLPAAGGGSTTGSGVERSRTTASKTDGKALRPSARSFSRSLNAVARSAYLLGSCIRPLSSRIAWSFSWKRSMAACRSRFTVPGPAEKPDAIRSCASVAADRASRVSRAIAEDCEVSGAGDPPHPEANKHTRASSSLSAMSISRSRSRACTRSWVHRNRPWSSRWRSALPASGSRIRWAGFPPASAVHCRRSRRCVFRA